MADEVPEFRADADALALLCPGLYDIDPTRSVVLVTARKLRLMTVRARLTGVTGTLRVVDPLSASSVHAQAEASTFESGNRRRDAHVRGRAFLDAERHRDIRFHSDTLQLGPEAAADGYLYLGNAMTPLRLLVDHVQTIGPNIGGSVHATLLRSRVGVGAYRWLVSNEIRVDVYFVGRRR